MSGSLGSIVTPLVPLSGTSAASCSSSPASGLPQPSDASKVGLTTVTPRIRPTVLIICRRDMRPSSYSSTISPARYRLSRQESFKTAHSPASVSTTLTLYDALDHVHLAAVPDEE